MTELEAAQTIYRHWLDKWQGKVTTFEGEVASSSLCGWCRISIRFTLSIQDTLGNVGSRRYQRKAAVNIQIFEPIGGVEKVLKSAIEAKNVFEGKTIMATVDVVDPAIDFYQVNIGSNRIDGAWMSCNVEALCNFYEHK